MPPQQKQEDPYAEFGGSVATEDPYAEFSGQAQQQPQQAAPPSAASRAWEGFKSGLGIVSPEQGRTFFAHPIDTARGMLNSQGELGARAGKEFKSGDYLGAATHGIEYMLPGIGPALANAGDKLQSGDIAGGVGMTAGIAAPTIAAEAPRPNLSAIRPAAVKTAGFLSDVVDPDITGIVSPRIAHVQRALGRFSEAAGEKPKLSAPSAPPENVPPVPATGPHADQINADPRMNRITRVSERPNGPIHGSGARIASPAAEPDVDLATRRPPAPTETPKIASPEASTPKRAIDMSETELSQQYKRQGIQSKSFEQADELARGRAENKAVMEHPGEESIPSQHSQPKIASPAQPSLTRDASGAPEAVWPKEYKQPTNGGGGNYTADDLSKLKQKHGIASPDEDLTPQLQASLDKVKTKAKIESIGDQVESSLGGKKLAPDVPLRNQIASPAPNGHTAVESSALKSYKYDPNAKEFHAQFKSGDDVHVYGDVSPEEAKAFEGADSKGKAIQSIKRNPLVAKIVNGKRVAVKPSGVVSSRE